MRYPRVGGIGTPHMVPIYNKQMRERFVEASGDCDAAAPTAQQNNSAKQNETSKQIRIRGVSHFQGWNWTRVPNNPLTNTEGTGNSIRDGVARV